MLVESEHASAEKLAKVVEKQTHLGIFSKAKQLEATGKKIIHMEVGEPDYSPPTRVAALAESFRMKLYHYTDTRGLPSYGMPLLAKEGGGICKDHVVVTPGGPLCFQRNHFIAKNRTRADSHRAGMACL